MLSACTKLRIITSSICLGEANGSDARSLLASKYRETLLPGGSEKLGVVFFHFWSDVVDKFVHANAEVCPHLPV